MPDTPWREAWDAQAEDWVALTGSDPFYDALNEPAFLELVPPRGSLTIEVGCGEGRMARALRRAGHTVVAIDGSPSLARVAAQHAEPIPVGVGDIHRLPLRTDVADLVVSFMVLMDIEDLDTAVAELARVLAPGGRLCIAVLHPISSSGLFVPGDEYQTFYMGEYLRPMRHDFDVERRDGGTFRFRVAHQPIEHYSRAFERAGLLIEAIREPKPTPEAVEQFPALTNWARVPNFLYLRARAR